MKFSKAIGALGVFALCGLNVTPSAAQNYPTKPIRFLVPTSASGTIDVSARMIARPLEAILGQPVLVENRPGATYTLATDLCAHAAPDGHTFCQININTHSFNPFIFKKLPYDPIKDFKPVYFQLGAVQAFSAANNLPVNTVAELKNYALKNKGKLNFATLGPGSSADLFRMWVNKQWDSDITGVAYGGAIAQAIMANESQITIVAVATMAETVNQGGAKFLAFSSKERVPQYPDVPTFNEIGFGSYPSSFWLGIAVPAGTPDAIVAKLNAAFVEAAKDPKYQEYLKANALESGPTTIEGFKEFMAKDRAAAETIIQITGVQPK